MSTFTNLKGEWSNVMLWYFFQLKVTRLDSSLYYQCYAKDIPRTSPKLHSLIDGQTAIFICLFGSFRSQWKWEKKLIWQREAWSNVTPQVAKNVFSFSPSNFGIHFHPWFTIRKFIWEGTCISPYSPSVIWPGGKLTHHNFPYFWGIELKTHKIEWFRAIKVIYDTSLKENGQCPCKH